jgi:hypothetical protein
VVVRDATSQVVGVSEVFEFTSDLTDIEYGVIEIEKEGE